MKLTSQFRSLGLGFVLAVLTTGMTAHANGPASTEGEQGSRRSAEPSPSPPFDLADPARVAAGKARFGSTCAAYCHGFEGSGGKTPAFRGRKDFDPVELFKTITEGRKVEDVMPAWGNSFSAEKRWELVAYIMSLADESIRPVLGGKK